MKTDHVENGPYWQTNERQKMEVRLLFSKEISRYVLGI
jgi:hypothetical protein